MWWDKPVCPCAVFLLQTTDVRLCPIWYQCHCLLSQQCHLPMFIKQGGGEPAHHFVHSRHVVSGPKLLAESADPFYALPLIQTLNLCDTSQTVPVSSFSHVGNHPQHCSPPSHSSNQCSWHTCSGECGLSVSLSSLSLFSCIATNPEHPMGPDWCIRWLHGPYAGELSPRFTDTLFLPP